MDAFLKNFAPKNSPSEARLFFRGQKKKIVSDGRPNADILEI